MVAGTAWDFVVAKSAACKCRHEHIQLQSSICDFWYLFQIHRPGWWLWKLKAQVAAFANIWIRMGPFRGTHEEGVSHRPRDGYQIQNNSTREIKIENKTKINPNKWNINIKIQLRPLFPLNRFERPKLSLKIWFIVLAKAKLNNTVTCFVWSSSHKICWGRLPFTNQ